MAGRPNKPLFELLREESSTGRRQPTGHAGTTGAAAELKPVSVSDRSAFERREGIYSPAEAEPRLASTTIVQLPIYAIYVTAAVSLALAIAAWSIGWQMGMTKGRTEAIKTAAGVTPDPADVPAPGPTLNPSMELRQGANPGATTEAGNTPGAPKTGGATGSRTVERTPTGAPDLSKPILGASGDLAADPREPKQNYLVIAGKMDREDAVALIALLSRNNLEAVGVPHPKVDSSGKPSKNDGLFKVVAVKGFTREQFRNKDPSRIALQDAVIRVGQQQWKDPKRGRTDLSSCYWESLVP